jgi:hypothetical protein
MKGIRLFSLNSIPSAGYFNLYPAAEHMGRVVANRVIGRETIRSHLIGYESFFP